MAEELTRHPDDFIVVTVDVDACPLAEFPLYEIYDGATNKLKDNYMDTFREYLTQQLEDTSWLDDQSTSPFFAAGFSTFLRKENGDVVSLRKPALERYIVKSIRDRVENVSPLAIPVFIRFMTLDSQLPTRAGVAASAASVPPFIGGGAAASPTSGGPSDGGTLANATSEAEESDSRLTGADATPPRPGATFRGNPVDLDPIPERRRGNQGDDGDQGDRPQRTRMRHNIYPDNDAMDAEATPRTHFTNRSGRTVTSHADLTYGAETFEDYMQQFMMTEVKYKDFRKATIHKFDSAKQDSFIHWFKLFCATCLQWGIWCPPYESVQEDAIYGCWWSLLPASVRAQSAFMGSLMYSALSMESVFPVGSREHGAVQGCPPNAGYHAIYAILRLHHPRLQTVVNTVNEIPRQRRAEVFSSYLRRLHDFLARERIAGRNYSEYEALDLSVRNLSTEWRSEIRRLVERDRRSGRLEDTLPFHLTMAQLATTFVQYAGELGRSPEEPAPSNNRDRFSVVRRIDAVSSDNDVDHNAGLLEPDLNNDEIELLVRSMSINQASSPTCLGCGQPGHTLVDCNRFVDYVVAESLAQRHPQLKVQVANAHPKFRSRLNLRRDTGPTPSPGSSGSFRASVRSILASDSPVPSVTGTAESVHSLVTEDAASANGPHGYQLNAIRGAFPDSHDFDEFEECFAVLSLHTCPLDTATAHAADSVSALEVPFHPNDTDDSVICLDNTNAFLLRRLAETYDAPSRSIFAHADNGSMACTTSDSTLLYSYRPMQAQTCKIKLFDAGNHPHQPTGVGFLRVPAFRLQLSATTDPPERESCSVFIRTYHTASIPGVIISHSAISRQLATNGYTLATSEDQPGYIRFPLRSVAVSTARDVYVPIQPTRCRGGLTFTDALIIPTEIERSAPLPTPVASAGRYLLCDASVPRVSACPPGDFALVPNPTSPPVSHLPEFDTTTGTPDDAADLVVRALSRSALRLLWHQRLGHVNFRRLADMHHHATGIPQFSVPDLATENCSICLASKLRKTPRGQGTTMTATQCMQGLGIDFAFMVQRSSDLKRFENLVGFNGETCYVLLTDHFSGRIFGRAFATKAPPVDWLNQWLANNAPDCSDKYVRMDGGGELGKCREIHVTFNNFGYQVQLTGPDASSQNGPAERPHQTIGDALRAMLSGADLRPRFWPYAFYHFVRLYNVMPHGNRTSSPIMLCGGPQPDLSKLRTFGCRVHVRPTTARWGRLVQNSRLGIFLGYSRTFSVLYYYDVESALVKTATHARFDEGMNDLDSAPPNVDALRRLSPDGSVPAMDRPTLASMNLAITDDPFNRLDSITQSIRCNHPTLGFEINACHIRRRGYLCSVASGSSASYIRNIRRKYIGAFIVSVNGHSVFTCASILAALSTIATSDDMTFTIVFAPDRYIPVHSRPHDSPIHLSVDQLRVVHAVRSLLTVDPDDIVGFPDSIAQLDPSDFDGLPDLIARVDHDDLADLPDLIARTTEVPEPPSASIDSDCDPVSHDHFTLMMRSLNTTVFGTEAEQALGSFTRRKLKKLDNWNDWLAAEAKQLDSMAKQEMYGAPVYPPPGAIILRQHWNYSIKSDGTRKARNCCDGSPRAAPELKLANTYSSCIEHPCMRMFFALCAHEGYICVKIDATNAYANSPPPDQPTFVYVDAQYADWYRAQRIQPVLRDDQVLPVQHALQGHPESGALWERMINRILARHGFKSTTHERSLYVGVYNGFKMLISRQVDDLAIGSHDLASIHKLVAVICAEDKVDLRDEGILASFNGVDVHQMASYISITCESYIDKLLKHYGWDSTGARESGETPIEPIAMSTIPQLFTDYEALANADSAQLMEFEVLAGFSYRSVLGAVIYVYVVARPDIGFAVTLLARFSDHPAKVHFDSLRRLARYLRMTKDWGLFFWRPTPMPSLPAGTFVIMTTDLSLPEFPEPQCSSTLAGYVDAAHATDLTTRRSITGLAFMLCGGPIAYKSKVQSTVSTSSTEAEFIAAVQAAKIAKYLRSILDELGYAQPGPTVLYEDNQAAILMINASRPTPRSRHIDIQHFAIQEWKAQGDIILCHIPGIINPADALTKSLGTTLHFRHVRRLMGHYGAPWTLPMPPSDG
jgi:Reverse transcriptase (RNA-dependent DNA polymerase)